MSTKGRLALVLTLSQNRFFVTHTHSLTTLHNPSLSLASLSLSHNRFSLIVAHDHALISAHSHWLALSLARTLIGALVLSSRELARTRENALSPMLTSSPPVLTGA